MILWWICDDFMIFMILWKSGPRCLKQFIRTNRLNANTFSMELHCANATHASSTREHQHDTTVTTPADNVACANSASTSFRPTTSSRCEWRSTWSATPCVCVPACAPSPPSDAAPTTSGTRRPPLASWSLGVASVPGDDVCAAEPAEWQVAGSSELLSSPSYLQQL